MIITTQLEHVKKKRLKKNLTWILRIRTHDLYNTVQTVLKQLSCQTNLELVRFEILVTAEATFISGNWVVMGDSFSWEVKKGRRAYVVSGQLLVKEHSPLQPGGGGGTPLYGLYRYVRPQRVGFFSRFGHK